MYLVQFNTGRAVANGDNRLVAHIVGFIHTGQHEVNGHCRVCTRATHLRLVDEYTHPVKGAAVRNCIMSVQYEFWLVFGKAQPTSGELFPFHGELTEQGGRVLAVRVGDVDNTNN